jgi:hypothetical protein
MSNTELRFPDFFIVGAGKAGTTALWKYLSHHRDVFMTKDLRFKELAFFSDNYGMTDEQKYLSCFKEAKKLQRIGESCHTYLSAPETAQRIHDKLPDSKIIIMLRDPVKRAYSLYNWMVMQGNEKLSSFKQAVSEEEKRMNDPAFIKWATPFYFRNFFYLHSGLFYHQVEPYIRLFGNRCKVYLFEEFNQNPELILKDISELLEINYNPNIILTRENESRVPRNIKLQFYLQNDFLWKLNKIGFSKVKSNKIIRSMIKLNTSSRKPVKLSQLEYEKYRTFFAEDIRKLSVLLQKNLDEYWKY